MLIPPSNLEGGSRTLPSPSDLEGGILPIFKEVECCLLLPIWKEAECHCIFPILKEATWSWKIRELKGIFGLGGFFLISLFCHLNKKNKTNEIFYLKNTIFCPYQYQIGLIITTHI